MVERLTLTAVEAAIMPEPPGTNERTMKKTLLVFALIVVAGMLFSSCNNTHSCPAYGKVHKVPATEQV
jgi:hypothetical protein